VARTTGRSLLKIKGKRNYNRIFKRMNKLIFCSNIIEIGSSKIITFSFDVVSFIASTNNTYKTCVVTRRDEKSRRPNDKIHNLLFVDRSNFPALLQYTPFTYRSCYRVHFIVYAIQLTELVSCTEMKFLPNTALIFFGQRRKCSCAKYRWQSACHNFFFT